MTPSYSAEAIRAARTFLFVPGDRLERFAKAVAAQPDIVVVDLEDAVSAAEKDAARGYVDECNSTAPGTRTSRECRPEASDIAMSFLQG
jgi:citrate lyase beta subunit